MNQSLKIITTLVFSATLLLSSFAHAREDDKKSQFRSTFKNESQTRIKIKVFHSDGKLLWDGYANPGKNWKYFITFGCKKTKTRSFKVWEEQTETLISKGVFTMITRRLSHQKHECVNEEYEFDSCIDKDSSDNFDTKCTYSKSNDGKYNRAGIITIKTAK